MKELLDEKYIIEKLRKKYLEIFTFIIILSLVVFIFYNVSITLAMDSLGKECLDNKASSNIIMYGDEMKGEYSTDGSLEIVRVSYRGHRKEYERYSISEAIGKNIGQSLKDTAKGFWDGIWNNQNEKNPK
jgi:hypothetical protein